jgi:hypothetical protein
MKFKNWVFIVLSFIICSVLFIACQSPNNTNEQQNSSDTKVAPNKVNPLTDSGKLPEYLPNTFPLPQDADISTSHSAIVDGKKTALLIFTTQEDMSSITKLYKDYFKTQKLDDSNIIVDNKNIIIQGDNIEKGEDWSVIGGALSEGGIELIVTWSEL